MMLKQALFPWVWMVLAWGSTASWGKGTESATMTKAPKVSTEVRRLDLEATLGPLICEGRRLQPRDLWALGIWDAQLEGQKIDIQGSRLLSLARLLPAKAKTLATLHHAGGYAYGTCGSESKEGWILSVPSPVTLHPPSEGPQALTVPPWHLPVDPLRARCAAWRVDYVAANGGDSQLLGEGIHQVPLEGLASGLLTLTCQPKSPPWLGPVVWGMRPVGRGPAPDAPFAATLEPGFHPEDLVRWVNLVRARERRPALSPLPELNYYASLLAVGGGLGHDRQRLRYVARKMENRGLTPLGEDRVKGEDTRTMAWLLWNSPRHRALLLDPKATSLGWGRESSLDANLVVLITAAGTPPKTSQTIKNNSYKAKNRAL